MTKKILSCFSLTGLPFSKEIKTEQLLKLPTVENALNSAKLLVETRGIGLLTGKSGSGKSCILRLLNEALNPALYKIIYLCHSSVGLHEFYTHLTAGLGLLLPLCSLLPFPFKILYGICSGSEWSVILQHSCRMDCLEVLLPAEKPFLCGKNRMFFCFSRLFFPGRGGDNSAGVYKRGHV